MSLSSIFSFETLHLSSVPRHWWRSLALAGVLLIAAEAAARILLAPVGEHLWTYWDADAVDRFEWYRTLAASGNPPDVVFIGDSTAARNIDPAEFSAAAGGLTAYNMGWPANFPLALAANTFELLETGTPPRYVVLVNVPTSYFEDPRVRKLERSVLNSVIGQRHRGEWVAADWLYLARLYPARHYLLAHWLRSARLHAPPARSGFMPHVHESSPNSPSVRRPQSNCAPLPPASQERRATVRELAALARRTGFRLLVLLPPVHGERLRKATEAHARWLSHLAEVEDIQILDFSRSHGMTADDFKDAVHLWHDSASRFSRLLGNHFSRLLRNGNS